MNFHQELVQKGLQPSVQRVKILEFLWNNRIHPTVDDIYERLQPDMPMLSRTTVYNTVKLFTEHEILQPLTIEENEIRYDINTLNHGHFKCDSCGKVFDFSTKSSEESFPELEGFEIRENHLYLKGLCKTCRKQRS